MRWKASLLATVALLSLGAGLPKTGPVPERRPQAEASATEPSDPKPDTAAPPAAQTVPIPEAKPETETEAETETKAEAGTGDVKKELEPKQTDTSVDDAKDATPPPEAKKPDETPPAPPEPPLTIAPEDEAALQTCMADLKALGAHVEPIDRIDDDNGCGVDKPVRVDRLLPGVALSPAADFRCETALQLARFVKQQVIPTAEIGLPTTGKLTSVNHASAYVCRKRNGASTGKISEHARGNAVDIGSLSFGRETVPMRIVKPEDSTMEDAFQRAINATACLYFSTVLSPGSDAAHEDHMHLDVLERKGGYRYCR